MSNEIIQSVAYVIYSDFQYINFIFSENLVSIFWGLFNNETDLKVMYTFYNHGRDLVVLHALNFVCACSEENVC